MCDVVLRHSILKYSTFVMQAKTSHCVKLFGSLEAEKRGKKIHKCTR